MTNKSWFMIPARAGSKTIPRKNVRVLAGKPLILYVLETINDVSDTSHVVVTTDDDDVKDLASNYGFIHHRSSGAADDVSTPDDVALEVAEYLKSEKGASDDDILMTVQPTSPLISAETIRKALKKQKEEDCDTVITVTDDRHLRWTIKNEEPEPLFDERVNRQQMWPVYSETGGVISTRIGKLLSNKTRIGESVALIEVDEREGLDIDTYADWALAEYWFNKLRIALRVNGGPNIGFGHLYRALAIAQNIHSHDITFVTDSGDDFLLGRKFLSKHNYPMIQVSSDDHFIDQLKELKPDIVINDILDTDVDYVNELKDRGIFVVNFEDLGEGNRHADVVVNDLYPDIFPQENHWYGVENSILNPNFETVEPRKEPVGEVDHILLAYGGADPSNLTEKAIKAIKLTNYDRDVTVVVGPGCENFDQLNECASRLKGKTRILSSVDNMALLMKQANLALTSAGRTVTELMTVGVPTIAMCQNMREMRHNHASSNFGVVNLGLGQSITPEVLAKHIEMYLNDENLRCDMYNRMTKAVSGRSNFAVVSKILSAYQDFRKNK